MAHLKLTLLGLLFFLLEMAPLSAQAPESYPKLNYDKSVYSIEMRDGIKLYTVVYSPKDQSKTYPILMKRTPYSCKPYEADAFPKELGPSHYLQEDGYIFVYQDVRGRWMSEGEYTNMTPHIPNKTSNEQIDESTDTYDTIDWLIKNIKNHNGKVGQWGISYPGFYTTAGTIDAHPAMKASSPQAPIADFYFDDFHHRGAYFLSYFAATEVFGHQTQPTTEAWYDRLDPGTRDAYRFFLDMGSLANGDQYLPDNFFWEELSSHPNYDEFWQARNILPHLKNIDHAVMTVGGWFDAEDLYGPLHTYGTIEKNNPGTYNTIVMGPWSHGDWARDKVHQLVGNIHFGNYISDFYQKEIERNFFNHFLKDGPKADLPEAYMFDTGAKEWGQFDTWPPKAEDLILYPQADGQLLESASDDTPSAFVSDPMKPVPYTEDIEWRFTPRPYMTGDQRFASRRPDVLSYESEPLEEDLTIAGPIMAELWVSTDQGDADWVVKLIDVYPGDYPENPLTPNGKELSNYEMMVRSEAMRGRFRESFETPKPFEPNTPTKVDLPLQDVYHTFKKGHRIKIHIQSTWFPLIDRNPQKYVDNIFEASDDDFTKANHKVYHDKDHQTKIKLKILKQ